MAKKQLIVSYDREADVMYLSFGEPQPSITEEQDDYVLVRRDPATKRIQGVTITNFSEYFEKRKEIKISIAEA